MELPAFTKFDDDESMSDDEHTEVFYTEGCQELKACRLKILKYSIAKSQYRLSQA